MRARAIGLGVVALAVSMTGAAPASQDEENPIVAMVRGKVADPGATFVLVVKLKTKPGQEKALEKAFAAAIPPTLKEKGCEQYSLSKGTAEPGTYLLYEKWAGVESLKAHLGAKHIEELLKTLGEVSAEAPAAEVFVPVGD